MPTVQPPRTLGQTLRRLGPGLIISANIVGSGELIVTTQFGAEVGFTLLWFIIFSCFIKTFVQIELGRYTISEGKTTLQALDTLPGPRWRVSWILWFWAAMYLGTLAQMSGMINAIGAMFGDSQTNLAAFLLGAIAPMVVIATLLSTGRYRIVEGVAVVMVALFSIATIVAVGALQWTEYAITWGDIAHGLSFQPPPYLAIAVAAFGVTGVGAGELIFYPYWCLEKGYAAYVGPREDTGEWLARARGWIRVLTIDAWLSMFVYTTGTVAFYLLGAAMLHGGPVAVSDSDLVAELSTMYSGAFGPAGTGVFLVGAFLVLFSTLFVSTASNARLLSDGTCLFGLAPWSMRSAITRIACVGIPILVVIVALALKAYMAATVNKLIFLGATGQALMLPLLGGAAVYFMHRRIDPRLRPRLAWRVLVWISVASITALGVYFAGEKLGVWKLG